MFAARSIDGDRARIAAGRERRAADRRQRTGAGVDGKDRDAIGDLVRNVRELAPRIDATLNGKSPAPTVEATSARRSRA